MLFPYLKTKVILVKGHEAYRLYDLNQGQFHRVNLEVGLLLNGLDGTQPLDSFPIDDRAIIHEAIVSGLVETQTLPKKQIRNPPSQF